MSRLLDTTVCPDCRAHLDPGATCVACGLRVTGPPAVRLLSVMRQADALVEELRAASPARAAVTGTTGTAAAPGPGTPDPVVGDGTRPRAAGTVEPWVPAAAYPPTQGPAHPRRTLSSASVPAVLLGLGGLCLLVAATVFVAVAWEVIGLTGRTLVLGGVTLAAGVAAAAVTRRGLSTAAQATWSVVAGMLVLDLAGGSAAGLPGLADLGGRSLVTLVGATVATLTLAVTARAARPGRGRAPMHLPVLEVWTVLGVLVLLGAEVWTGAHRALGSAVAAPLLGAAAVTLGRLLPPRLRVTTAGLAGLTVLTWLSLLRVGTGRALADTAGTADASTTGATGSVVRWWLGGHGWPLLVAGLLAAAAHAVLVRAARRTTPGTPGTPGTPALRDAGPVLAGAALLAWSLLVVGPQSAPLTTTLVLLALVVLALGVLAGALASPVPDGSPARLDWARGAAPLALLGAAGLGAWLLLLPGALLPGVWTTSPDAVARTLTDPGTRAVRDVAGVSALVLPLVGLAVAVALLGAHRVLPCRWRGLVARPVAALAPLVLGLGCVDGVLGAPAPLVVGIAVALVLVLLVGASAWWVRSEPVAGPVAAAGAAYAVLLLLALPVAHPGVGALLAAGLAGLLVPALVERHRAGSVGGTATVVAATTLLGARAVSEGAPALGVPDATHALALAVAAAVSALLPDALRVLPGVRAAQLDRVRATSGARVAVGLAALLVTAVAAVGSPDFGTLAVVLTVAGTAVCLLGAARPLERPDLREVQLVPGLGGRPLLAWAGSAVLAAATAVRVLVGVPAPEVWTLPAAALLVVVGAVRLRRDPAARSRDLLGSGVTLALLPGLVLALGDPVSLRGLLVALGGLVALGAGVRLRLSAPYAAGALTVGLLALRHLTPVVEAVPRWITLGTVGVLLLVVGITWEARRRDLTRAQRHLVGLR